ncbi:MAG TPA: DUF1598 domain-containing protein [Pirellulales bacterium]|nr:DUF1598 domain-containing protein [Pirellulales bacterium]
MAVLAAAALAISAASALADDPASSGLLAEQLAAGEFAPAIADAGNAPPGERDARLAQIAGAQAEGGDRDAALSTAGDIGDDMARYNAIERVKREPVGGRGGGVQPDFDSLIELITSTIAPTTWSEVGGAGAVKQFPTGVYVDPAGMLCRAVKPAAKDDLLAWASAPLQAGGNRRASQASRLRKISLTRLERQVQLQLAAGRPLDDELLLLAGLERIEYVLANRETGDLVIAGPAGDWQVGPEARMVSRATGRPVVRLDDLVAVLRHVLASSDMRFGCTITPTQAALARTQQFVADSSRQPLAAGKRKAWLRDLRDKLGAQEVEVQGIDPRTRVAQVLVEADYRMKLVGIGLEEGTLGVPSYLDMIHVKPGEAPPAMDVLRWWFTMNYQAVLASPDRQMFQLRGTGVKVLSENELLNETGGRVHTGQSDALNQQFADNFTAHFADLAARYPVYAELQNIFDLALVSALIKTEGLAEQVGWHMTCFQDAKQYPVNLGQAPRSVETVINHRVVNRVHVLAAVSGGVSIDPAPLVSHDAIQLDRQGRLQSAYRLTPAPPVKDRWWWD